MNRFKKLIYFIVFAVVLLMLIIFAAIRFINPNHYKAQIIQMVHEKTGRDLEIKGDIALSFFPWIGVTVNEIHLANPVGFQPQVEFASVGKVDISVKVMPLLSHKIEVGEITLRDLRLNLYKNKAGLTNWQDLANAPTTHQSTAASADLASADQDNRPPRSPKTVVALPSSDMSIISIAGVNIDGANIHWHDDQKSQDIQISHLKVTSDHPQIGVFFPFHLDLDIASNKPAIAGHLSFQTQIKASFAHDDDLNQLALNDINLIFESPEQAQRIVFMAKQVTTVLKAQTLVMSGGVLSINGMSANIDMQLEHLLTNPVMTIYPLSMNLYGGLANGKIVATLGGAIPRYIVDGTASNIDLTQLIQSGRLMGKAKVKTHLTFSGKDQATLLSSLNGNVQLDVQKGALMGMDIPYQVERALALLRKQAPPPSPIKNQTDFDVFKGTGQLRNGVLSNEDLLIQSPKFQATGNGTANLVSQALNYHLSIVGLQGATNAQKQVVQTPSKTAIAVSITGTFDHPMITPDIHALIKSELGQTVIKRVQDKLQKLSPEGANALKRFLQH